MCFPVRLAALLALPIGSYQRLPMTRPLPQTLSPCSRAGWFSSQPVPVPAQLASLRWRGVAWRGGEGGTGELTVARSSSRQHAPGSAVSMATDRYCFLRGMLARTTPQLPLLPPLPLRPGLSLTPPVPRVPPRIPSAPAAWGAPPRPSLVMNEGPVPSDGTASPRSLHPIRPYF